MIISHKHKFIFIKTNKTAGTSVEIALSEFCGPDDVITPISPEDERLRAECGGRAAQHYQLPFFEYGIRDWGRLLFKRTRAKKFYNHIGAALIRERVAADVWNGYFKFCIERNPWERVISQYYWHFRDEPRPSLMEFIESGVPAKLRRHGRNLYTIDGRVVVDRVCRFENLAQDLDSVRLELGLPRPFALPHAKSGTRKDKRGYREIMSEAEGEKVAELFREEVEELGYEY